MDFLAVAIAGFLGAVSRGLLTKLITVKVTSDFPVSTLIINLTGCFILSFFLTLTVERLRINPNLRLAVGTGFLGAYTTFSTFAVDSVKLLSNNMTGFFLLYVSSTALGCVLFAWLGVVASRTLIRGTSN